jgi:putative oxygen-independent coproporphyrinogen III oxidase
MAQLPKGETAPSDGLIPLVFDSSKNTFHAYVHIPYCLTRCGYCDFNTYTATELGDTSQADYFHLVMKEIDFANVALDKSGVPSRKLSSIFFGGGTPTLLPVQDLISIYQKLVSVFGIEPNSEVTTEANPDSVDEEYLRALKDAGFTRVSFGMQSAVPAVLKVLERTHNPENVAINVQRANAVGLQTSVDLIYGTPGESLEDWRTSLESAIAMNTDHISAYSLIVEPGTKLARQIKAGEVSVPDESLHADMYELAEELLTQAGFSNYEVSNWAKSEDLESKHNVAYWQSKDWWGFGPGAHSHVGGVRWWNVKHPAAYAERIHAGSSPASERELVDQENRNIEKVMLEARLAKGMDVSWLKDNGFGEAKALSELIADSLVDGKALISGKLVLTLKGRLLADLVVRRLLGF